jgi:hypothetical protein
MCSTLNQHCIFKVVQPIQQFCHNQHHSIYDPTWWWTPVKWLIIYYDLCNHPIIVRCNFLKNQKIGHICIRFFIYDWTLTGMTLVYSYFVYNYIPRIPSMVVALEIDLTIIFTMCIPTYVFLHEYFFLL